MNKALLRMFPALMLCALAFAATGCGNANSATTTEPTETTDLFASPQSVMANLDVDLSYTSRSAARSVNHDVTYVNMSQKTDVTNIVLYMTKYDIAPIADSLEFGESLTNKKVGTDVILSSKTTGLFSDGDPNNMQKVLATIEFRTIKVQKNADGSADIYIDETADFPGQGDSTNKGGFEILIHCTQNNGVIESETYLVWYLDETSLSARNEHHIEYVKYAYEQGIKTRYQTNTRASTPNYFDTVQQSKLFFEDGKLVRFTHNEDKSNNQTIFWNSISVHNGTNCAQIWFADSSTDEITIESESLSYYDSEGTKLEDADAITPLKNSIGQDAVDRVESFSSWKAELVDLDGKKSAIQSELAAFRE